MSVNYDRNFGYKVPDADVKKAAFVSQAIYAISSYMGISSARITFVSFDRAANILGNGKLDRCAQQKFQVHCTTCTTAAPPLANPQ